MGNNNSTTNGTKLTAAKIEEKRKLREEKEKHIKISFNVEEKVIQNYRCFCSWERDSSENITPGKVYFTQNYILYEDSSSKISIPFIEVERIAEEKHLFTWITVQNATKKYYFSKFVGKHYYEALNLFFYLWKNPPSYLNLPKPEFKFEEEKPASPPPQNTKLEWGIEDEDSNHNNPFKDFIVVNSPHNNSNNSITNPNSYMSSVEAPSSPGGNQTQLRTQVNTAAVKEALANLVATEQMGADTLMELEKQARTIDNIENTLENISAKIDRTDRLMRGIESLPAYIGNSLSKKKDTVPVKISQDRSIHVNKRTTPPMEIEILCKNVDCSLQLALLSLNDEGFQCLDIETQKPLQSHFNYLYKDILEVALRTRPEHMDFRFLPPRTHKDRFRLMSSYNQIIVNELYYRTKGKIKIVFEPGCTEFDYGMEKISTIAPIPRKQVEKGFVFRGNNPDFKLSSLVTDQEAKSQLEEVDTHLTQISSILGRVYDMSEATGKELDRQNEQLEKVNKKVDVEGGRIEVLNKRINYQIHN